MIFLFVAVVSFWVGYKMGEVNQMVKDKEAELQNISQKEDDSRHYLTLDRKYV